MLASAVLAVAALPANGVAAARSANVESWVHGELADYVAGQLEENPRLRDVTVRFVVFEGSRPVSKTDSLSLRLRDQLQRRTERMSGLRIAWQPGPGNTGVRLPDSGDDCQAGRADLLIGIDMTSAGGGDATVTVRALDMAEQTWVPGFGTEWHGTLLHEQRRAAARQITDRTFLGDRDVPYQASESDLIATHLARNLRCLLMRRVSGDYAVATDGETDSVGDPIVTLVRNQLGGISSLQLVAQQSQANAALSGARHTVDRGLHQYWLTLMPTGETTGPDAGLAPISTSVYMTLPVEPQLSERTGDGEYENEMTAPLNGILTDLSLVALPNAHACRNTAPSSRTLSDRLWLGRHEQCSALRISAQTDAIVFVLNHQLNHGLVRMGGCSPGPSVHVASPGRPFLLALPEIEDAKDWTSEDRWQLSPDASVYYAIAVSDSKAARAIADRISALPKRCSASVRAGVDGARLEVWLRDLKQDFASRSSHVDWRAIQVRQIY